MAFAISCAWITLTCLFVEGAGILLTTPVLNGCIGEPGSLFCHFKGSDKWLVIQWLRKRSSDGVYSPFVSLLATSSDPEWAPDTDVRLIERVHPYIRRKGNEINFSLYFRPLACEDQGEYRCLVVGLSGQQFVESTISLQAYPQKPEIIPQETVVPQNSSVTLECTGNVGYPPAELQWFKKSTNENIYTLVQPQSDQILRHSSTCLVFSKRYLKIRVMTEGTYRCAAEGSLVSASDPRYYGEVSIRIAEIPKLPPIPIEEWNVAAELEYELTRSSLATNLKVSSAVLHLFHGVCILLHLYVIYT